MARLVGLVLLVASVMPALLAAQIRALHVGPVVMTVADIDRSVKFYTNVLTFEKQIEVERSGPEIDELYGVPNARIRAVVLKLGNESIELLQFIGTAGAPVPPDSRSNDLSFQHVAIIVRDGERAYAVLRQNNVAHISPYPQRLPDWNPNAAGIKAFYFRNPDGHPLEILQFPPGKGNPKWQISNGKLFLGIDHTAIAVSNTSASLEFYRKLLGLQVAGESENYGFEQEHLNNVFGAHLRITSLRGPSGMGVEFLEYITPSDGRPAPANGGATDISHHETVLLVDNIAEVNATWAGAKNLPLSVKQIAGSEVLFHASQAELIRDPDGHPLLLLQR
jgi:catechol 2,3-dioxygenase-like lactoylglutathione lyase family enzyme